MPLPRDIRAVTFDCFGTLIDWNAGIGRFVANWASQNGLSDRTDPLARELGAAQRRHQVSRPFKSYRTVLRSAFLDLAKARAIARADADADRFSRSVATWPTFPDTLTGLAHLKQMALIGVMSNVDEESFADVRRDRLGHLVDEVVTADEVRAYKPDHAHFAAMEKRLSGHGIGKASWLHVAQSRFHDIAPCRDLGIACVWLDRIGTRRERGMTIFAADAEADLTVTGMAHVVAAVEAARC